MYKLYIYNYVHMRGIYFTVFSPVILHLVWVFVFLVFLIRLGGGGSAWGWLGVGWGWGLSPTADTGLVGAYPVGWRSRGDE